MTASYNNLNRMPRVVVVNDDATQLNVLCGLLHKAGLEALAFKSAESALAFMGQAMQPDLIVTDVYMPGIDGWRFCRLLRSREYERFNLTPILVVSATFSGDEPSRITADLGASAFLSMPVDGQQFIEQVQALLKGEKAQAVLKALIVEDSKLVSKRIVDAFRAQGYQAHAALTLQEALSLLVHNTYDIAVMDYHLPDGLGDELLQVLQQKSPECVCMMMTADPQPDLALTWMKMGAAAYLHKPFEPEYLIALCERARRECALLRSQDLLELRTRQLQESEQKYRSLIHYSSDPIFSFNPDETYLFVNEAFAQPFGKKPEEIIGKTPFDIFPPEEAEKRLRLVRRIFATCEKGEIEVKVVTHTGEERFYLTQADPIKDEQGQVLYVTCISKDITKRKQADKLLENIKNNYVTFFNSIDDFLFVLDEQGNIMHINKTVSDRLGYSEEELFGQSVLVVHPPERREEAGRIVGEMLAGTAEFCPVPLETKWGEQIPVETRVTAGFWNDRPAIFGVTKDISQIQLSEEKFSKAFHSNSALMALSRFEDGTYLDVNEIFLKTLGFTREEVIGRKSTELRLFADGDQRNGLIENIRQNGKVKDVEVDVMTKNGSPLEGLFSADTIYIGKDKCLLTVMLDITQRKQSEGLLRAGEKLGKQMLSFTEELLKTGADRVTYQKILENLLLISKAKYGALTLLNERTGKFTTVAVAGMKDRVEKISKMLGFKPIGKEWNEYSTENEKLKGKVVSHFSSISELADNVIPEIISKPLENLFDMGEVTVTKIIVNGQMIGDFTLIMSVGKKFENDTFVEMYSRQIDLFMTREKAEDELRSAKEVLEQALFREKQLSRIDDLTGINNRRSLFELAEYEFEIATRYRPPLTVLMFDVDVFKHINDAFGHAIGDQVLKYVTQAVCANLRSADTIGRYGGDEFVILLPQTNTQEAKSLAERIHASLATQHIKTDKGPLSITISLGIAQTIHSTNPVSGHVDTVENLFMRADQAMYMAKQAGRNRTAIFDPDKTGAR